MVSYRAIIKYVLGAPELNQLLLTFGLAMVMEQLANLIWTSRPIKLPLKYVSASATIGSFTFGTFEFVYVGAAIIVLVRTPSILETHQHGAGRIGCGAESPGGEIGGYPCGSNLSFDLQPLHRPGGGHRRHLHDPPFDLPPRRGALHHEILLPHRHGRDRKPHGDLVVQLDSGAGGELSSSPSGDMRDGPISSSLP